MITTRPIQDWPGTETPDHRRQRSRFKTGWSSIVRLLERELRHLGARSAILEIDCRPWDLRQDGMLRSNARPQGPRVIISAETKHGPMRIPCDTFTDHESNLYAIALSLEKLRAVDRYGVTMHGEQYRGWTAIPASTSGGLPAIEAAWDLLVRTAAGEPGSAVKAEDRTRATATRYYREAAKIAHPDAGGTDELFVAIGKARDLILGTLAEREG